MRIMRFTLVMTTVFVVGGFDTVFAGEVELDYKKWDCKPWSFNESQPKKGWGDSYSIDGKCFCASNFDHGAGDLTFMTPAGLKTIREICDKIGPGPGKNTPGAKIYNDIQCGNGPANNAGDENPGCCPGRVDLGPYRDNPELVAAGCKEKGSTWDLSVFGRSTAIESRYDSKAIGFGIKVIGKSARVLLPGAYGRAAFKVVDARGKTVWAQQLPGDSGSRIEFGELPPGTYVIRATIDGIVTSASFFIAAKQ